MSHKASASEHRPRGGGGSVTAAGLVHSAVIFSV